MNENDKSESNNSGSEAVKKASDKAKKEIENQLKKRAGKSAAVKGKLATAIGPVLFWTVVIIVAIIIIIGIIMFFSTLPGMVMENLKAIGKAIAKAWNSWWGADDTQYVEDEQIYEALDYLEKMGYDLKEFGFLTEYVGNRDDGVERGENGEIINAKSDFIKTYLASDNYVYTIKNHNLVTDKKWKAFWQHVVNFFGGSFDEKLTRGLIAIYNEGSKGLGDRGDFYTDTSAFNGDEIILDIASRKLKLRKGRKNQTMEYDLDGWTGRYGMPIDFLMSVHFATMMPDLAYDMANNFDTEIVLILHSIDKAKVSAAFYNGTSYITYENMKEKASKSGWWIFRNDDDVTREEAQTAMTEYNIHSPDDCENNPQCSEDSERKECCGNCEEYVQKILDELRKPHNDDFSYYVPYIESVKNHWYRNVYFAINDKNTAEYRENIGKDKIEFVRYDDDYEILMKERWTLYETYENGEFKLYALNSEGRYATNPSEIENYSEDKFEKEEETGYYLFKGSLEEQAEVLRGENENGFRYNVSKMAKTLNTSNTDKLKDFGWTDEYSGLWTAYEEEGTRTTNWEKIYPDSDDSVKSMIYTKVTSPVQIIQTGEGQRSETNAQIKKMFLSNKYFRYDGTKGRAELITRMRLENDIEYGPLSEEDLRKTVIGEDGKTYTADNLAGQVIINQDSLNVIGMLENTHTLDSDYIYRDFKELIVELGYFTKEELTDETPRLLEWIVPNIASSGYPNRTIDKRENEYGTAIHSKGDIEVNKKYTLTELLNILEESKSIDPENPIFDGEEDKTSIINVKNTRTTPVGANPTQLFDTTKKPVVDVNISNEDVLKKAKELFDGMINAPGGIRFEYCVGNRPENCKDCSAACKTARQHSTKNSCSCTTFHCNHITNDGRGCGYEKTFQEAIDSPTRLRNVCCAVFVGWVLRDLDVDIDTAMEAMGNTSAWRFASDITRLCVEYLGAEIITEYDDLKPGDIMSYIDKGHVDILGEKNGDNFAIYGCGIVPDIGGTNRNGPLDRKAFESGTTIGLRFNGAGNNDKYVGYDGNEAVVSPVTGILLEYGTYNPNSETRVDWDTIQDAAYRVNVDLKYGPIIQNEENTNFESQIISDSVGYAKILVLTKDYYYNLEQSTSNRWNEDSGGQSLLKSNGTFREELVDDATLADDKLNSNDKKIKWPDIDQTIYGYKEFAERYEKAGIAGYVVFIDGFVCEKPDKSLKDVTSKLPYEDVSEDERNKSRFTIEESTGMISFKSVTEDNFTEEDIQLESAYIKDKDSKLFSISATNKEIAESTVKDNASTTMYISNDKSTLCDEDLIYIKEGTIIGRTMTDKELLEADYLRNSTQGTYDEIRESEKDENNKVIGNYIRIIMRDLDGTPVENVENYMKIDSDDKGTQARGIQIEGTNCYIISPFLSTDIYILGGYSNKNNNCGRNINTGGWIGSITKDCNVGLDIARKDHTDVEPVYAPINGIVYEVDKGNGSVYILDKENGVMVRFVHLRDLNAQVGQNIKQGDYLGKMSDIYGFKTPGKMVPRADYEILIEKPRGSGNYYNIDPTPYLTPFL